MQDLPRKNEGRTYTNSASLSFALPGAREKEHGVASYHFETKIIGRSGGKSAVGAAAYRSGGVMTCPETGEVFDYRKKTGILDAFIMAPETAPEWSRDRQALWSAVQAKEARKNSQLAREFILALPHELTATEGTELVRTWVRDELVSVGMVADVAIHDPHRRGDEDDPPNRHVHIMLTMRELDPSRADGWATNKKRDWNDTGQLERWRESWANVQNATFEARGLSVRVDHRSLEAQRAAAEAAGDEIAALVLSRPPEPRLGLSAGALEAKGITTDRGDALREARADRARLEAIAAEVRAAESAVEDAALEMDVTNNMAAILKRELQPTPEDTMRDLTKTAIERQLKGMGLDAFEVTVAIPGKEDARATVEVMTPAQIVDAMPRLKQANKAGYSVYIRGPRDRDHDLILLDDIEAFTSKKMEQDGLKPAALVETSPGNFQAWIRLGEPLPADVRREAAQILATRYGGDPGAVDAHQSGRLAGFTNPKPQYKTMRGSPFVLLHSFAGRVVEAARDLINGARTALAKRVEIEAKHPDLTPAPNADADLVAWWRAGHAAAPAGKSLSEVDWHLTHLALGVGRSPEDVAAALEVTADRKGRHASEYAVQTVSKAAGKRLKHDSDDDLPSLS